MKATIIYHSVSGNTKKMAETIVKAMNETEGFEARAFSIDDVDYDFAKESKCMIVGTPIYAASISAAMKSWLEAKLRECSTAGKLGGAFATVDYIHGGGELGIRTIMDHMLVFGMMTYSGGASEGRPVIHLGPVAMSKDLEGSQETFEIYARRMAKKTVELFSK